MNFSKESCIIKCINLRELERNNYPILLAFSSVFVVVVIVT